VSALAYHSLIVLDVLIACGIVILAARYMEYRERKRLRKMKNEVIVRRKEDVGQKSPGNGR